jgi:bacterioferritin-associated ferredoxin
MYVCMCKCVTDRDIHNVVELGVCSMGELRNCLGVSTQCGKCADCAKEILQEALGRQGTIEPLAA